MAIRHEEALAERARNLGSLNGLKLVLVSLPPDMDPPAALLDVHFHNDNELAAINSAPTNANPALRRTPQEIFPITGGFRVRAGSLTGQVQVVGIEHPAVNRLLLTVRPIGDYSTYTLRVEFQNIDPIFSELPFKFRPGCFSIDCAPEWEKPPVPQIDPTIDYLAKDYTSFRHTLIAAMIQRVPGWRPTSEADLDQTLLELFSVAADELSDFQDRVMNEAYLATARKRVSLARHARLMDYHIHQGNQASTWLALEVLRGGRVEAGFTAATAPGVDAPDAQIFVTRESVPVHPLLNRIGLYTWSNTIPSLAAGSTQADLRLVENTQAAAQTVRDLICDRKVTRLLIQEHLDPATGREVGRDPAKRQLLELLPCSPDPSAPQGAKVLQDPLTGDWIVQVRWAEKDRLRQNYCFRIECPDGAVEDVSLFHGNLARAFHGRPAGADFLDPAVSLVAANQFHYERTGEGTIYGADRWGTICRLPDPLLAYTNTPPGGEVEPISSLSVEVEVAGASDPWEEQISLIHSQASGEESDHFIVETDEDGRSLIRFGNGVNGRKLPEGAIVHCRYQVGRGSAGNVGADALVHFRSVSSTGPDPQVLRVSNPFDVTDGRDPEPVAEILRRVPEAYRFRQLRAVTLADYVRRAEEVDGVSRAAARYMWTGSWRTVRITIDPRGTTELTEALRAAVAEHLEVVRLIGEDLEIRPPRFVPLTIRVALCIHPDYWPEDLQFLLEQEFSDGFTADGRLAFFNPDRWTFGQELHASQIIGRAQAVEGVEHVNAVIMKRFNEARTGTANVLTMGPNEILQVRNDPDHMEKGSIQFDLKGGRR